jgi:Tfp pilus assembly protein PilX
MMNQKTVILTIILFTLIVLGMFVYARMRSNEMNAPLGVNNLHDQRS